MDKMHANEAKETRGTILLCHIPTAAQIRTIKREFGVKETDPVDFKAEYEKQKQLLEQLQKLLDKLLQQKKQAEEQEQRKREQERRENEKRKEELVREEEQNRKRQIVPPSPAVVKQLSKLEKKRRKMENQLAMLNRQKIKASKYFFIFLFLTFLFVLAIGVIGMLEMGEEGEALQMMAFVYMIVCGLAALFSPLLAKHGRNTNERQKENLTRQLEQTKEEIKRYEKML